MAGYIGSIPVPQATQTREAFTATSNQTTFNTGGYTAGFIDVYMNGVKLAAADFTATNGSDVVLASGAAANDIVEVVAYTAFEVLNQNFTGTTTVEALTATGAISGTSADFDGGVTIDNITIDGAEIDLSSGNLLLDVAGNIILDADSAEIIFKDGGTSFGRVFNSGGNFYINAPTQDTDIIIQGNDGGSNVNALSFDMSNAGAATFNSSVTLANTLSISSASTSGFLQASSNILQFGTSSNDPVAFFANNAERIRITSSGALQLSDVNSPNDINTSIFSNSDVLEFEAFGTNGAIAFSTGSSVSERMRLTVDGRLGLGTSSPDYTLSVEKDVDTWASRIYNTGSDANAAGLLVRTDATAAHNAYAFAVYADSAYKMVVQSNGKLGIGTITPDYPLHVHGTTDSYIKLSDDDSGQGATDGVLFGFDNNAAFIWNYENGPIRFATGGTEHMRISGGNVMIGTTTEGSSEADDLTLSGSGHIGMTIRSTDSTSSRIYFSDATSGTGEYAGYMLYDHPADSLIFGTASTERMRISGGNLLVGKTSTAFGTAGINTGGVGYIYGTRAMGSGGTDPVYIANILTNDGNAIEVYKDGTVAGSIGVESGSGYKVMYIANGDTGLVFQGYADNAIMPFSASTLNIRDAAIDMGSTSARFHTGYFSNGTSSSSDQNEKQNIAELTSTELAVSKRLAKTFRTFRRIDAVEAKGDNARTHTGTIAQEVHAAFAAEGLDAAKYGMYMSDTWKDNDDKEITRLGIRYEQLLSFISAGADQRLTDIETRLAALEG